MNERAIKLYEEATEFAYKTVGKEHAGKSYFQGVIAGKFAELIVKECIDCAVWVGKSNHNPVEPIHTAHAVKRRIEKHFGVEE